MTTRQFPSVTDGGAWSALDLWVYFVMQTFFFFIF